MPGLGCHDSLVLQLMALCSALEQESGRDKQVQTLDGFAEVARRLCCVCLFNWNRLAALNLAARG